MSESIKAEIIEMKNVIGEFDKLAMSLIDTVEQEVQWMREKTERQGDEIEKRKIVLEKENTVSKCAYQMIKNY